MRDQSHHAAPRAAQAAVTFLLSAACWLTFANAAHAIDYILTIGGGYSRTGNQASLEANVVFFQQVLAEKHRQPFRHDIYFADGLDPAADLQVLAEKPAAGSLPATELLAALHRRGGPATNDVTYRNHRVPSITGPLDPKLIRARLEGMAQTARAGDRLIVYVTSHGSGGPEDDEYNTTIDCWNERKFTAREFTEWLGKFSPQVPVVMVMAQCYCGGFAQTMFKELDKDQGAAAQLRAGFFAQQHDLPAAGCRPDIEHDEEFSSYFWGAIVGRSRNGVRIDGADINGDRVVSFAEAYAHAVVAGETIDIPLRTSEVYLRTYSRLTPADDNEADAAPVTSSAPAPSIAAQPLATMTGTLQSFVDRGRPVSARIVKDLSQTLGFSLQDDVSAVVAAREDLRRAGRGAFRGGGRGGRGRGGPTSGRREVLAEVTEKWPELADARRWRSSELLKPENQQQLATDLQELPSWKNFDDRRQQSETARKDAERNELKTVKFRRLIATLEVIVLEQNLPHLAPPEILARYQQLIALEESALQAR